jgi:hypothetical protein
VQGYKVRRELMVRMKVGASRIGSWFRTRA